MDQNRTLELFTGVETLIIVGKMYSLYHEMAIN